MPHSMKKRLAAMTAALFLVCLSFTAIAAPGSSAVTTVTAPAATDATTPSLTTATPTTSVPGSTGMTPDSSSMLDTPLTTTPDTVPTMPEEEGFAYTGLVIALVVAGLAIALIILLVPKNKDKS